MNVELGNICAAAKTARGWLLPLSSKSTIIPLTVYSPTGYGVRREAVPAASLHAHLALSDVVEVCTRAPREEGHEGRHGQGAQYVSIVFPKSRMRIMRDSVSVS